jgi:hypothetical protein
LKKGLYEFAYNPDPDMPMHASVSAHTHTHMLNRVELQMLAKLQVGAKVQR